jgi:acetyl-CoA acetyltransferase
VNRRIVLVDSDVTDFGTHVGHSALSCASGVAGQILVRNREVASRVGLIVVGAARMAAAEGLGNGLPQFIGELVGLQGVAGVEVHSFCASANTAVREAAVAIEAGRADAVLVVGLEHLSASHAGGPLRPEAAGAEAAHGFSPPVFYAICAHRYLHDTGAPVSALAQVAVHNRRHGAGNPHARFQNAISVEEVLASRLIADPLTLLQCCPSADGSGALLLAAAEIVEQADRMVELRGCGAASADPEVALLTSFPEDIAAARTAYAAAGVGPDEIDVAEVHDAFTISQVIHLEDVGLAPRGEGWRHALETAPRTVVNPSGGLLSRGHPLGATGIAQFHGVRTYLLDDRIEPRQRRFGLVQEAGGLRPLGQMVSECAVLAGPAN